jgi:hypothetical protein
MYFRDCKTLSIFERKIPLTFSLEFRFHQDHFFIENLIFQFTDFSQDYSWIVCHILRNPKRNINSYGSAARLDQAIVIKA